MIGTKTTTLLESVQISSSGVFHARLLTPTSTLDPEAGSDWLLRCTPGSMCNRTLLACLSHAHTSSIPSSSSSSSSLLSMSSSSVQPLCVTPTPGASEPHTDLVARFPIEFTWPVSKHHQFAILRTAPHLTMHLFLDVLLCVPYRMPDSFTVDVFASQDFVII